MVTDPHPSQQQQSNMQSDIRNRKYAGLKQGVYTYFTQEVTLVS